MVISPSLSSLTVIAATALEANAVRRAAPRARVIEVGIGLAKLGDAIPDTIVSCGLAGALRDDVPTGSVLVPETVSTQTGTTIECDLQLGFALAAAARRLGHEPVRGPLLSSKTLVTGPERAVWAQRGYVAVDMETGFLTSPRVAAIRVVLDTPARELSPKWIEPLRALAHPELWPQAFWLFREGPRCARLAATILALAFKDTL